MPGAVDLSGLDAVFRQFQARGGNLQPALRIAGETLIAAVNDVYQAEGPGWPALAEATVAARRKEGAGHKILQDTGIMKASTGVQIGSNYVEASAGVSYAEYHAKGEGVPVRNPFDLGPFEGPMLEEVAAQILNSVAA